jgi:hypothetical protein
VDALRAIYKYLAALIFVGVVAQIGAAGYGAFYAANKLQDKGDVLAHKSWDDAWNAHGLIGTVVIVAMILLLLIGLGARLGRPAIWLPLALAIAGVVQMFLAALGASVPGLGFLHPLNALLLFGLSGLIAHRAWRNPDVAPALP